MFTSIALFSLGLAGASPLGPYPAPVYDRPQVQVWTNRGDDPYTAGQGVRVSFQTDQDAYVTIFRVDTDGRVRVLFPRQPWEDNFARGGRSYDVPGYGSDGAFDVDDYPGVGYLFGIASADPFDYDAIETAEHWDYRSIADDGRVRGDPYVALTDLAERLVPSGYTDWDYDVVPYYVQQHYQYPRFLCYDCHTYASYTQWNPYAASCVRFRIVMYDDPYYYPYRYYGGTRVVFRRPYRPEPRFIFKDRVGSQAFFTRAGERPVNPDVRREVDVRSRYSGHDVRVPSPNVLRQRGQYEYDNRERPVQPDRRPAPERVQREDQHDDRRVVRDGAPPATSDRGDRSGRPAQEDRTDRGRPDQGGGHQDHPDRSERRSEPDRSAQSDPGNRSSPPPPAATRPEPRRQPEQRSEPRGQSGDNNSRKSNDRSEPELHRRRS